MAYKSPIEIIQEEARIHYEDAVVKAIQPYLISVNKDELIAALKYDRAQYDNGYADGRAARDADIIRCKDCKWYKEGKYFAPTKFCFRLKGIDGEEIGYNFASDDFCSRAERKEEQTDHRIENGWWREMTFDEMWADLKSKYPKICITAEQLSNAMKDLDAVCVVRCKDCKWFNDIGCAIRIVDDTDKPKDDDYCSFGERKGESTMGQLNSDEPINEVEKL